MNPLAELPRALSDLYGTDPRGRWMLQRAGLPGAPADGHEALAIWTQVTLTAMLRGRLLPLLTAVLQDHPDHPVVVAAILEVQTRIVRRRRRRLAWFFGIGILMGGALAALVELPRAGRVEGRVLGLPLDLATEATVRIEGCLRAEPVSPNGAFALSCPRLDKDVDQVLVLEVAGAVGEAPLPSGVLTSSQLRVAFSPQGARLRPPGLR